MSAGLHERLYPTARWAAVEYALVPLPEDPPAAARLAIRAAEARIEPGFDGRAHAPVLARTVEASPHLGRLIVNRQRAVGIALWSAHRSLLGLRLAWLHLEGEHATTDTYRWAIDEVDRTVADVAFVAGPLAGLAPEDEERTMRSLRFAPFARSEMVLERSVERPIAPDDPRVAVRRVRPEDEAGLARLHEAAYRGRFDRYLFLEDVDPRRDALRHTADMMHGRWGTLLPEGSTVAEEDGRVVGGVLTVRTPRGPLIVDVETAPDRAGRGVARAALSSALYGLAPYGLGRPFLNVTDENRRAYRLYEGLGFARRLGPSREWYRTTCISATPHGD